MAIKLAEWITPDHYNKHDSFSFYKAIKLDYDLLNATIEVSAKGMYRVFIDGSPISDNLFGPGWTSYKHRVQYETVDITKYLAGKHRANLEIKVAEGWCCGRMGWKEDVHKPLAPKPAAIACVTLEYYDRKVSIVTDPSWLCATNEITTSTIYDGEVQNFTLPSRQYAFAALDQSEFGKLIPWEGEKIVEHTPIRPKELIITPKGETVVDFGQNFTGYVRLSVKGRKGQKITVSHAEVLDKNGNFFTKNLRSAKAQMVYILDDNERVLAPNFTFMGFRYAKIEGLRLPLKFDDIEGVPVYSQIRRTGYFSCGSPLINKLYENIIWGQRSNFLDVPTDCPQRDERLGWTGDAQVFIKAASFNYDVLKFFKKWLRDLALDQREDGSVTNIVPNVPELSERHKSAAWGDAATVCPWQLYVTYGDISVLREQFESMRRWIEFIRHTGPDECLWQSDDPAAHFGDWLALDVEGDFKGATPHEYIANCYYLHSLTIFVKAGQAINKDMREYEDLLFRTLQKVREACLDQNGLPIPQTQTAYALALQFGLIKDSQKQHVTQKLVELIKQRDYSLTTGFVGTPLLLHALADNGRDDIAFKLLLREQYPSWLYCVLRGATTIWEHWDGIDVDGDIKHLSMTSFNHYAFGAVADFLYQKVCGINLDERRPGFKKITIAPHFCKELGYATTTLYTLRGVLSSSWYYDKETDEFVVTIMLPEDIKADFVNGGQITDLLPGKNIIRVKK